MTDIKKLKSRWQNAEHDPVDFSESPYGEIAGYQDFRGIYSRAHIHKQKITQVDFSYSDIGDFLWCEIDQCIFYKATVDNCLSQKVTNSTFHQFTIRKQGYGLGEEWSNNEFKDCKFTKVTFTGIKHFKQCRFLNVKFIDVETCDVPHEDCLFENCVFKNTSLAGSLFKNCIFKNCRYEGYFCVSRVVFDGTNVTLDDFSGASDLVADNTTFL